MRQLSYGMIAAALVSGLLVSALSSGAAAMTDEEIRTGYLQHAAMAQAHRWYQYYENAAVGLPNQLDILAPDVSVSSGLGEVKGHAAYTERVTKLPATWKNAHFIHTHGFKVAAEGSLQLQLEITYLNQGLLPDGAVRTADLTYTTVLKRGADLLPPFQSIAIAQKSEGNAAAFKPAYADNRLLSLVHYWLAIIEDPSRKPEPVREILASDFSLNFSSGAIKSYDGFKTWLAGPGSQVSASTHVISNFSKQDVAANTYKLTVDFDWVGILPNGAHMAAKTRHRWTVLDNPTERFARILSVDVDVLEPFTPKP